MMTEKEKAAAGHLYDANNDPALLAERRACKTLCHELNGLSPLNEHDRNALLQRLLGTAGTGLVIETPFMCDYGYNIHTGHGVYFNTGCVILDEAPVKFGHHVFVGPQCGFYTAIHPLDARRRNAGLERALPISVGNDVWIGGHVTVLPGVSIGDGAVVGAGSVVTRDVPPRVVAAGNPCRVLRRLSADELDGTDATCRQN